VGWRLRGAQQTSLELSAAVTGAPERAKAGLTVYANRTSALERAVASPEVSANVTGAPARAEAVRGAIRHLWRGYKAVAWRADEVMPLGGQPINNWCGVNMQTVELLDTLWLAGLHDEFREGEQAVKEVKFGTQGFFRISFFEMTIRALGGLLSAHALSGSPALLEKATDLGDRLGQAFHSGGGSPWPAPEINVHNPSERSYRDTSLAEAGSNGVEFTYLSQATGDMRYKDAAFLVMNRIMNLSEQTKQYLPPTALLQSSLEFLGVRVTAGAGADSYFEYLLKMYLQSGQKERRFLDTFRRAMREVRQGLIQRGRDGLTYLAHGAYRHANGSMEPETTTEQLGCFFGGLLALAAHALPARDVDGWWLPAAKELGRGCYERNRRTPSGLAAEIEDVGGRMPTGVTDPRYLQRPETLETLFYLHRATGDEVYRDWSWDLFQAIDKSLRTKHGYAQARDVRQVPVQLIDKQETFMGAEVLKYALLIQLPPSVMPLDKFVFNTEAHPVPVAA